MTPRSEPLLWLQLIALGAIPLELLGLLLLLAGADPGPLPGLERLLAWAIGALGPAILLWKRPADVCSLLVVQAPLRARSEAQRTLSALQSPVLLKLAMVGGAAALLPLFWWMDQHAALAASLSPLAASPRLVGLLFACPLLALLLWQWQQLTQALALLRTRPEAMTAVTPLTASQLDSQRLNLGLPLLLLSPLEIPEPQPILPEPELEPEAALALEPALAPEPELELDAERGAEPEPEPPPINQNQPAPEEPPVLLSSETSVANAVAIQPEETAEEPEGSELDQQIP